MPALPDLPTDRRHLPVGVFDSGIGGLTVAQALAKKMPYESFIYFGDTAHMPYGEKSVAALQAYAVKITEMLLAQPVKAIVIACNTASAAAFDLVKEYVGSRALVLNVIDPTVAYVAATYPNLHVGLIGTRQTVQSGSYAKRLDDAQSHVHLHSLATPLLAPMIEEGFFNNTVSREVIHNYLSHPDLASIEALVLACTHYPLIKAQIEAYYKEQKRQVAVLDASELVASAVSDGLAEKNLSATGTASGLFRFFVSDYTPSFEASSQLFFGKEVKLQLYPLWN